MPRATKLVATKKILPLLTALSLITAGLISSITWAIPVTLEILPVPVSITVTPTTTTIDIGQTQQFTAVAVFADSSTLDITANELITWNSDNAGVASISNNLADRGLASALSGGTANITAIYGGVTSNGATLTIGGNNNSGGGGSGPIDPDPDPDPPTTEILIEVHPEKRHDFTGRDIYTTSTNQDIDLEVQLFQSTNGSLIRTLQGTTNDAGIASFQVENLNEGVYDISVKTISHLRSTTPGISITFPGQVIDLSNNKTKLLLAGDVNATYGDNFVNGIDYSVIANQIYTNNKKSDLNRDTTVNAIDFAITTANIYKTGDN